MMIKILDKGIMTTIQDIGRYGQQHMGLSPCGAMDKYALMLGNILVGNPEDYPVFEMSFMPSSFLFEERAIIALTGGSFDFYLNGSNISMWKTIHIEPGDILTGRTTRNSHSDNKGVRVYLAVKGKIQCDEILGSYSTDLKSQIGGLKGRCLQKNDSIEMCDHYNDNKVFRNTNIAVSKEIRDMLYSDRKVHVIQSFESKRFVKKAFRTFIKSEYIISSDANRMGYRLTGPPLTHKKGSDILSSPVNFGSIQVPANGQPMIMMADHQTTGGYTKIGQVIEADLSYLAQKGSGDKLSFQFITVEEAIQLIKELNLRYSVEKERIQSLQLEKMNYIKKDRQFNIGINGRNFIVSVGDYL